MPNVGTFDTKIYQPLDRQYDAAHNSQIPQDMTDRQVGAKILIEFTPDGHFELANGNTISLIQTVRETIAKTARFGGQNPENVDLMRENNTGGFPLRSVTDDTDDLGWLIDHQLFTEQQGAMPPAGGQNVAIANYATARGTAIQALANFPNELALVQTTPIPLAMNARYGPNSPSYVRKNNFTTMHVQNLQRVISRLRASQAAEAKQAVEAVRSMVQYEYATRNTITLRNLDPRYAEERTQANDPLKPRPVGDMSTLKNPTGDPGLPQAQGGGDLLLGHTFNAACDGNGWTTAALSDEPTVPFRMADVISGGMEFEVAALLEKTNGEKRYVGSVKWGWQMIGGQSVLSPAVLTLADGGNASGAFFKASQAWNAMTVPDPQTGAGLAPVFNLPTAGSEFTRLTDPNSPFQMALQGNNNQAITDGRDKALDMWGKLTPGDKVQHRVTMLRLLDQYEMKVNHRRPSQLTLIDQYNL